MPLDLSPLDNQPRLLIDVPLQPVQGSRFQPTGFPDLGAATFTGVKQATVDGKSKSIEYDALLVESAQSMANRLEGVCWDQNANDGDGSFVSILDGTPYVRCNLPNGRVVTSVTESHRLNSPYFQATAFQKTLCEAAKYEKGQVWDPRFLASFLFKHDPNSLIHGVFFSSIQDGRMRLPRALSSFIEAELPGNGRGYVESGFARREDADPSGNTGADLLDQVPNETLKDLGYAKPGDYRSKLKENVKNIVGSVTEFTATSIVAYFNLDLAQLRGYGLPDTAYQFLVAFSLYKIRAFLDSSMRLRSRCTFMVVDQPKYNINNFVLPEMTEFKNAMPNLISAAKPLLSPKPLDVEFVTTEGKGKK